MHAHIEEFTEGGVIRVFADGETFPGPYQYAFPFRRRGDEIELVGITSRSPTAAECYEALRAAADRGWSVWARRGARVRRWQLERIRKLLPNSHE